MAAIVSNLLHFDRNWYVNVYLVKNTFVAYALVKKKKYAQGGLDKNYVLIEHRVAVS